MERPIIEDGGGVNFILDQVTSQQTSLIDWVNYFGYHNRKTSLKKKKEKYFE